MKINALRPRQNRRHFADDIFKCIFLNENVSIAIKISLKFVPKGPINNISALFQIIAWHRLGDKSLFEPMMVSLPTHICVTRPQLVNILLKSDHFDHNVYLCRLRRFSQQKSTIGSINRNEPLHVYSHGQYSLKPQSYLSKITIISPKCVFLMSVQPSYVSDSLPKLTPKTISQLRTTDPLGKSQCITLTS